MKRKFILFLGVVLLACNPMSSIYLRVLQPAMITMPKSVDKIVVINRYRPKKKAKLGNILEGFITGEKLGEDRNGAEEAVVGLITALRASPRFEVVNPMIELKGSGTMSFPNPLSWEEVAKICKTHDADLLVTLEAFDSDARYSHSFNPIRTKDRSGNYVTRNQFTANYDMIVSVGWRIYVLSTEEIIDEYMMSQDNGWQANGLSEREAKRNLPYSRDAVKQVAYSAGQTYAVRISPTWLRVNRYFYTKSKKNKQMELAAKKAKSGDWLAAANIWKKLASKSNLNIDPTIKDKACYNMAVASEVSGNVQSAIEWAKISADMYNNRRAIDYLHILEERSRTFNILDQQMK